MIELFQTLKVGGPWALLVFIIIMIVAAARYMTPKILENLREQRVHFFEELHRSRAEFTASLKEQRTDYLAALQGIHERDVERNAEAKQRHEAVMIEIREITKAVVILTTRLEKD